MFRAALACVFALALAGCGGQLTPPERDYLNLTDDAITNIHIADSTLATLAQAPQRDQAWHASHALHIAAIRVIAQEAAQMQAPSQLLAQAHVDYRSAMRAYAHMADAYERGNMESVVDWRRVAEEGLAAREQRLRWAGIKRPS